MTLTLAYIQGMVKENSGIIISLLLAIIVGFVVMGITTKRSGFEDISDIVEIPGTINANNKYAVDDLAEWE
jgi:hypothetical protein